MSKLQKRIMGALAKLAALLLVFNFPLIALTNSYFTDQATITGNTFSTGYWEAPQLVYPKNNYLAVPGSAWLTDPYMDWTYSLHGPDVRYVYESSHNTSVNPDGSFSSPAYVSGLLTDTQIPAPGTPDGEYFWHVRALINGVWTPWSEVWKLTVDRTQSPTPAPGRIVINEVFYDVDSAHQGEGTENHNEWVELYNVGGSPVDISGWVISDNGPAVSDDVIPQTPPIQPDQFVVITPDSATWGYWPSIPSNAVKIVLTSTDHKIGNGLQNNNDHVVIKNNGSDVDAVGWGTDTYAFNPPVPGVDTGHSISRKEKGVETDTADDWMDTYSGSTPAGPNPGTNPHLSLLMSTSDLPLTSVSESILASPTPEASPSPTIEPDQSNNNPPEQLQPETNQTESNPEPDLTPAPEVSQSANPSDPLTPTPTPEPQPATLPEEAPTPTPTQAPKEPDPTPTPDQPTEQAPSPSPEPPPEEPTPVESDSIPTETIT